VRSLFFLVFVFFCFCVFLRQDLMNEGQIDWILSCIDDTLQHTATHWNALQRTAKHCKYAVNTLQHTVTHRCQRIERKSVGSRAMLTTRCNALQRTATHCNTLQNTAKHCNTLQHTGVNEWSANRLDLEHLCACACSWVV